MRLTTTLLRAVTISDNTRSKKMISKQNRFDRICTLGPEGTFSYQAAYTIGGSYTKKIEYTTTVPQIVHEVQSDENVIGVMPIENSTSGIVGQAQDCLVESDVIIVNELLLDVRYSLLSHVPLDKITRFFCHSAAFNQNMRFTSKHMPKAEVVHSNSNIHSGEMFLERPNDPVAAIVPYLAAHANPLYK